MQRGSSGCPIAAILSQSKQGKGDANVGKWFNQAAEIDKLRAEVRRHKATIAHLRAQITSAGLDPTGDPYEVNMEERALVMAGKKIEAIKRYRERTGAGLKDAKDAIDTVG